MSTQAEAHLPDDTEIYVEYDVELDNALVIVPVKVWLKETGEEIMEQLSPKDIYAIAKEIEAKGIF